MPARRSTAVLIALSFVSASIGALGTPSQADAAVKRCFNRNPTIVGTSGPDELIGTSGADVIAGLGGDDVILGGGGNDYICGNAGADIIDGEGGSDSLNGGADDDLLFGAGSADVVAGGSGHDILLGEQGNDTINGGGGFDYVGFLYSADPVVVDLRARTATGEGSDGIHYVEGVIGSEHADTMYGNAYVNAFEVYGSDWIHGRAESDWISFVLAPQGAIVDLELGISDGVGDGPDLLESIENVLGSPWADELYGDAGPNELDGGDGSDTIDGRGGDDICFGEVVSNCEGGVTATAAKRDISSQAARLQARGLQR